MEVRIVAGKCQFAEFNWLKILFTCFVVVFTTSAHATIRLAVIYQSDMVLQRDKEITIRGFGSAGEKVTIYFRESVAVTTTGSDGQWLIRLPSQPSGGPFEMTVKGETNEIILNNILVGDVWICGGQSNMQFSLDQIGYTPPDTSSILHSAIRIFTVPISMDYVPTADLKGGTWEVVTTRSIRSFSATGYFFGKFLHDSLQVPIGLISDNLGATSIETWMSREALEPFPQFEEFVRDYLLPGKNAMEIASEFEIVKPAWEKEHYLIGKGMEERWYLPESDTAGWKPMEVPGWWEEHGLVPFDGVVWFRRSFSLPPGFDGDTIYLGLNQIDDYDIAWVNGQKVGEGYGNQVWRRYKIPASLLKKTNNTLVVRVFDAGGRGGLYTNAIWWDPTLVGTWYYKTDIAIDASTFPKPRVVNISPFSTPAVLYNANIAPLTSLSIKGFIWYQGESNVTRAEEYRTLFPAMIRDWRSAFAQGDLPFLFVQLANYYPEVAEPSASHWAELREAQASALTLPGTGMAVAIDIGDANDIHPVNKMEVGRRLGLSAMNVAYGKPLTSSGPVLSSFEVKAGSIILHFNHTCGFPVTKDKYGYVRGFAVAGKDRKFYWARATIDQGAVTVASDHVKYPVAVRYAWSDNPGNLDLYNAWGIPAAPFRTDTWPLSTAGRCYTGNPWENN